MKDQVTDYLEGYAAAHDLPVRLNARVTGLARSGDGFEVRTTDGTFQTRQVVVATGPFQVPLVPAAADGLDASVAQVHSAQYRNPQALPDGPVLVVGGGNSGMQIARSWPPPARSTWRSPTGIRCCPSGWAAGTCSGG